MDCCYCLFPPLVTVECDPTWGLIKEKEGRLIEIKQWHLIDDLLQKGIKVPCKQITTFASHNIVDSNGILG